MDAALTSLLPRADAGEERGEGHHTEPYR